MSVKYPFIFALLPDPLLPGVLVLISIPLSVSNNKLLVKLELASFFPTSLF